MLCCCLRFLTLLLSLQRTARFSWLFPLDLLFLFMMGQCFFYLWCWWIFPLWNSVSLYFSIYICNCYLVWNTFTQMMWRQKEAAPTCMLYWMAAVTLMFLCSVFFLASIKWYFYCSRSSWHSVLTFFQITSHLQQNQHNTAWRVAFLWCDIIILPTMQSDTQTSAHRTFLEHQQLQITRF